MQNKTERNVAMKKKHPLDAVVDGEALARPQERDGVALAPGCVQVAGVAVGVDPKDAGLVELELEHRAREARRLWACTNTHVSAESSQRRGTRAAQQRTSMTVRWGPWSAFLVVKRATSSMPEVINSSLNQVTL